MDVLVYSQIDLNNNICLVVMLVIGFFDVVNKFKAFEFEVRNVTHLTWQGRNLSHFGGSSLMLLLELDSAFDLK